MARTSRELATRPAVDPEEEPSHAWGWHASFPRGKAIAGWFTVFALLIMIIGNHQGNIENLWLIGTAVLLAFALIRQSVRQRRAWRR
jgi:hypothetical protein